MNGYIDMQIRNMLMMPDTFEQSCEFAAKKDDGTISGQEEIILKKLKVAKQAFQKELKSIQAKY